MREREFRFPRHDNLHERFLSPSQVSPEDQSKCKAANNDHDSREKVIPAARMNPLAAHENSLIQLIKSRMGKASNQEENGFVAHGSDRELTCLPRSHVGVSYNSLAILAWALSRGGS